MGTVLFDILLLLVVCAIFRDKKGATPPCTHNDGNFILFEEIDNEGPYDNNGKNEF
jgi:hypothetical protein